MKIMRDYPQVTVSKKGERWLDNGHPWVYESDVTGITGNHENGDIVDVIGPKGKYLGSGFLSLASKIRVRIFSRDESVIRLGTTVLRMVAVWIHGLRGPQV